MNNSDSKNGSDFRLVGDLGRRDFLRYTAGTFAAVSMGTLATGCGGNTDTGPASTFPVAVFSDIHFNPYYDPKLFNQLVVADPSQWAGVFDQSTLTAPSAWGADTNYPSLVLALTGLKQTMGDSPLVIFTGDILGHYFSQTFFSLYYAGLGRAVPNAADIVKDTTAVAAMEAFADNTLSFFMDLVRSSVGSVPVMFVLGNADSYLGLAPEPSFLAKNAETFYAKFVKGAVDHAEFLTTFKSGGYYSAEPAGSGVMVIALNTTTFVPYLKEWEQSAVDIELAWLDARLAAAKGAGKKVWLLMHVPPGADIYTTATTDFKGNQTSTVTMMWDPAYQTTFLQIVAKYPGLIAMTLAAHTHMDEFRIYSPGNVLEITPSITPYFGNNPGFRVFSIAKDTLKPVDYISFNYALASNPKQFNQYYIFSDAYGMKGPLDSSLVQLSSELLTNKDKQALYRAHYFSGHNYSIPATGTFKQIADANWPVYYCGSEKMNLLEFVSCMKSY
jgi:hypothetical protein